MVADITVALAHVFQTLATHLDRDVGTLPAWGRQITAWRKTDTGAEGVN